MKCSGIVKEKNKLGKQVTRICSEKLDDHEIFCHVCGRPTSALSTDLSARISIKETWKSFNKVRKNSYLFAIVMVILLAITIYLSVLTSNNYLYNNLVLLIMTPLLLLPLSGKDDLTVEQLTPGSYFRKIKNYPVFFVFVLINILYFLLIKIICTGYLLGLATDPILHLVRLVLVVYWIVIVTPVPFLMIRKKMNPLRALYTAYKAGDETRWQQFHLILGAAVAVVFGGLVFLVGLLVAIPFFYFVLENYYKRMDKYHLFDI